MLHILEKPETTNETTDKTLCVLTPIFISFLKNVSY